MFILDQSDSYSWPVPIDVPVSGGKFHRQSFDAEFLRLPQERIDEIQLEANRLQSMVRVGDEAAAEQLATVRSIVGEILAGWSGITDKDGAEVPYSEAAKARLLSVPGAAAAILTAFAESLSTGKAKN